MIETYKSQRGIPKMKKQNHVELAKILFKSLRTSLHIACALGDAQMDFLIQICSRNQKHGTHLLELLAD